MSDPRYQVIGITGWTIFGYGSTAGGRRGTSYSIIDTATGREVFKRYSGGGLRGEARRRSEAHRECDRLNAIEASQT